MRIGSELRLGIASGVFADKPAALKSDLPWQDARMLADVLERVKHDYVNPVDDHQLLHPYYEAVFTKDVKYDVEHTGLGWKTQYRTTVADETLPTSCKMKRPAS